MIYKVEHTNVFIYECAWLVKCRLFESQGFSWGFQLFLLIRFQVDFRFTRAYTWSLYTLRRSNRSDDLQAVTIPVFIWGVKPIDELNWSYANSCVLCELQLKLERIAKLRKLWNQWVSGYLQTVIHSHSSFDLCSNSAHKITMWDHGACWAWWDEWSKNREFEEKSTRRRLEPFPVKILKISPWSYVKKRLWIGPQMM